MDQELKDWIDRNRRLINLLKIADEKIEYGQIIINYHAGKITYMSKRENGGGISGVDNQPKV